MPADNEEYEIKFAFDDHDDAMLVDLDDDDAGVERDVHGEQGQAWDFGAQAALINSIQQGLKDAASKEDIKQLNDKLVGLQSMILSARAEKAKAREEQNKSIFKTIQTAECVDLCFVIDATESMHKKIRMVKDNIRIIVRDVKRTNPTLKMRLAFVAYRDLHYEQRYEVLDFVDSLKEFEDFVCSINHHCAPLTRDIPEDMATGIQQANRLSWSQPTRLAFIVADQPCHGIEFHSVEDNYPNGTPGINIQQELRALLDNHSADGTMTLYFGRIFNSTDRMIARLKTHYGIPIVQMNFRDTTEAVTAVTKGVRSSVFKTVSTLRTTHNVDLLRKENEERLGQNQEDGSFTQKEYNIVDRQLVEEEWGAVPAAEVVVYKNKRLDLNTIHEPVAVGKLLCKERNASERVMLLKRAPSPFAEGSTRIAYHALLSSDYSGSAYPVILKSFKFMGMSVNDRKHYLRQMEVSNVAGCLARTFNGSSARPPRCGLVNILPVCVVEEEDTKNEESGLRRFCAEQPLPTDGSAFTRFSSNTGYWDESVLSETLLHFCKYTYHATGGYLLVTDFQGVQRGNDFFLTDPVILCRNPLRFGSTNVGVDFMKKCIDSTNTYLKLNGWLFNYHGI